MARTQLGDILTYPWDENSTNNSYVLDTNSINFSRIDANSTKRIGHVVGNKRRKYSSATLSASTTLGQEDGNYNDIDDFNSKDINLTNPDTNDTNATIGYKLSSDLNITISVNYISDSPPTPFDFNTTAIVTTTNIKMIEVSLKNSLLDGNITLRAFAANIGANQLLRRTFP